MFAIDSNGGHLGHVQMMFEYYGLVHIYSPRAGADNPMVTFFFS